MGKLIRFFYWRGPARNLAAPGEPKNLYPDLPGWSDEELIEAMPGPLAPQTRLPGGWWYLQLHTAPHQLKYQKKLRRLAGRLQLRRNLPDVKEFDVLALSPSGIDADGRVTFEKSMIKRSIRDIAAEIAYGETGTTRRVLKWR